MSNEKVKNGGLEVEVTEESDDKGSQFYVYYITAIACIGGLLFGYDTGIISGSMLLIGDNWKLSNIWKEGIVGATIGAAAVFALIAGFLTDRIGRKKVIMLASVVFTIGAVVMGASPNKEVLLVGRLTVGAGIGKCRPGFAHLMNEFPTIPYNHVIILIFIRFHIILLVKQYFFMSR